MKFYHNIVNPDIHVSYPRNRVLFLVIINSLKVTADSLMAGHEPTQICYTCKCPECLEKPWRDYQQYLWFPTGYISKSSQILSKYEWPRGFNKNIGSTGSMNNFTVRTFSA